MNSFFFICILQEFSAWIKVTEPEYSNRQIYTVPSKATIINDTFCSSKASGHNQDPLAIPQGTR